MKNHPIFKIIFYTAFIISILICSSKISIAVNTKSSSTTALISLENNLFLLTYNDDSFRIDNVAQTSISKIDEENFSVLSYMYSNNSLFILGKHSKNLPIVKYSNKGTLVKTEIVSDFQLKDNCIAYDTNNFLYLVDSRNPDTVYKYSPDFIKYEKFKLNNNIISLFSAPSDGNIYALTKNGIINIEFNSFIKCDIPKGRYKFFEGYCCDSDGNIFSFDTNRGFNLIINTEYENLCVLNNNFYGSKQNVIYLFSNNGNVLGTHILNGNIQEMCTDNSKIVALCNNNPVFIQTDGFKSDNSTITESSIFTPPPQNSKKDINSSTPPSESNIENDKSSQNPSSENLYNISSDKYKFINNMVIGIPQGTTAAVFKRNVNYGMNNIKFTNHNGKQVSTGQLGTGWRIDFIGSNKIESFYIIIQGDVTGEGNVNSLDINSLSDYLVKKISFTKYQLYAADINNDGIVDSLDFLLMYKNNK